MPEIPRPPRNRPTPAGSGDAPTQRTTAPTPASTAQARRTGSDRAPAPNPLLSVSLPRIIPATYSDASPVASAFVRPVLATATWEPQTTNENSALISSVRKAQVSQYGRGRRAGRSPDATGRSVAGDAGNVTTSRSSTGIGTSSPNAQPTLVAAADRTRGPATPPATDHMFARISNVPPRLPGPPRALFTWTSIPPAEIPNASAPTRMGTMLTGIASRTADAAMRLVHALAASRGPIRAVIRFATIPADTIPIAIIEFGRAATHSGTWRSSRI